MQDNTLATTLAMLAALISLPSLVAGCLSNVARIAVNLNNIITMLVNIISISNGIFRSDQILF